MSDSAKVSLKNWLSWTCNRYKCFVNILIIFAKPKYARMCNMFFIQDLMWFVFFSLLLFKSELTLFILNTVRPFAKRSEDKRQQKQVFLYVWWNSANRASQLIVHLKSTPAIRYFTFKHWYRILKMFSFAGEHSMNF